MFKWTPDVVYAWESCDYKCASANVNQRICYNNVICKCLETGERVIDGLDNTSGEYYYVKVTECRVKCVEDFNKYPEPVCLDEEGQIESIEKIENETIEDVKKNPSATINTGNLGSPDGKVPPQPSSISISTNSNQNFWCGGSGGEKKAQEAQKIITSAITGLLVAIFALFLYKLIAVDILHIPGIDFLKN